MNALVNLTIFSLGSLSVEEKLQARLSRKNWGIWMEIEMIVILCSVGLNHHQNLPFHVKRRFQLEDLSSRENRSSLLFPLALWVGRRVISVASLGAVFVIFFNDLMLIVRLVTLLRQVCLMRLWWLRGRRWRRRQRRWKVFGVACWNVWKVCKGLVMKSISCFLSGFSFNCFACKQFP